jgi:hypothetical protein
MRSSPTQSQAAAGLTAKCVSVCLRSSTMLRGLVHTAFWPHAPGVDFEMPLATAASEGGADGSVGLPALQCGVHACELGPRGLHSERAVSELATQTLDREECRGGLVSLQRSTSDDAYALCSESEAPRRDSPELLATRREGRAGGSHGSAWRASRCTRRSR